MELILADESFGLREEDLKQLTEPMQFVGRAPQQTEEFLTAYVYPLLEANREDTDAEINITV